MNRNRVYKASSEYKKQSDWLQDLSVRLADAVIQNRLEIAEDYKKLIDGVLDLIEEDNRLRKEMYQYALGKAE